MLQKIVRMCWKPERDFNEFMWIRFGWWTLVCHGWNKQNERGGFLVEAGASTIKWTTHDPCPCSNESNSKVYTNFEICEEILRRHFRKILIYKAKKFMMKKKIPRKVYIF